MNIIGRFSHRCKNVDHKKKKNVENIEQKQRCLQNYFGAIEKLLIKQYRTWRCGQRSTETLIP